MASVDVNLSISWSSTVRSLTLKVQSNLGLDQRHANDNKLISQ